MYYTPTQRNHQHDAHYRHWLKVSSNVCLILFKLHRDGWVDLVLFVFPDFAFSTIIVETKFRLLSAERLARISRIQSLLRRLSPTVDCNVYASTTDDSGGATQGDGSVSRVGKKFKPAHPNQSNSLQTFNRILPVYKLNLGYL